MDRVPDSLMDTVGAGLPAIQATRCEAPAAPVIAGKPAPTGALPGRAGGWVALAVLLGFALYTGWTMLHAQQSLIAFGLELMARPDTAQVVIDLYLMAGLGCIWMVNDQRARGGSWVGVVPYLLLTVVFVSVGPLAYLVVRGFARRHRV